MGIPIGHGAQELSAFGLFIEKELSRRGWTLTQFAQDNLKTSPPNLSRYLRGRRPPERIVTRIITEMGLSEAEQSKLRAALAMPAPQAPRSAARPQLRHMHRRSMRDYGQYALLSLVELIERLGWVAEFCEVEDDFAYDLKVFEPNEAGSYVLINLMQRSQSDPRVLLRAVRAQLGIDPAARQIIFLEPFASQSQLSERMPAELFDSAGDPEASLDEWLQRESEGMGCLAHGGNLVRVASKFLKPTEPVERYLNQLHEDRN